MKRQAILALLVGAIVVAGCASARRGQPMYEPVPIDSLTLARGEQVFMSHCHSCHPNGEGGLGFALNNKPLPGFLIKLQVRNGLGAMPAFSPAHISDEELDALVQYLYALRDADKPAR